MHENDELPEIKYIDSAEFHESTNDVWIEEIVFQWIDAFESQESKWHRLLAEFIVPLAGRQGYCFRIVEKYIQALSYNGVEAVQKNGGGIRYTSVAAPIKIGKTGCLPFVLKELSETTRQVNLAQYITTTLATIGQSPRSLQEKTFNKERLSSLYLFHVGYRQGLENLLSNYRILRNFRYSAKKRHDLLTNHIKYLFDENDVFAMAPESNSLALQMVLEDWNCSLQHEKVVQLAHGNTLQMRALCVKGDAYYYLNEALNCTIAFNFSSAQEETEEFDLILTPRATNARGKLKFQLWKLISKYERNRRKANPQGFIVTAQRLEKECKSDAIGAGCVVIVETSCKIRTQCKQQQEQIINLINETITRYPSLGPRMMKLTERCGVGYENNMILQQICDSDAPSFLHPSETTWLDYLEKLIESVGRFGSVKETLQKSLKIIFEFLDFDSNRFNERAWLLMEKVLELSDPLFVLSEWENRADWWSKYHKSNARDGRKMKKEVMKKKLNILEALEELVS